MEFNFSNISNRPTLGQLDMNEARKQAVELEGVFLNSLMSQMFSSIKTDGMFGGGQGEDTWRSMQSEQYANLLAQNGGVGLADQIMADLLAIQESASANQSAINAYSAYNGAK